jgi:hypothetical protein
MASGEEANISFFLSMASLDASHKLSLVVLLITIFILRSIVHGSYIMITFLIILLNFLASKFKTLANARHSYRHR